MNPFRPVVIIGLRPQLKGDRYTKCMLGLEKEDWVTSSLLSIEKRARASRAFSFNEASPDLEAETMAFKQPPFVIACLF